MERRFLYFSLLVLLTLLLFISLAGWTDGADIADPGQAPMSRSEYAASDRAVSGSDAGEDEDWARPSRARSPNDDRSDSMNPNNPAFQSAQDNRSNQLNPNNQACQSSRGR